MKRDVDEIQVAMLHVAYTRQEVEELLVQDARTKIERQRPIASIDGNFAPQILSLGPTGEHVYFRATRPDNTTVVPQATMDSIANRRGDR